MSSGASGWVSEAERASEVSSASERANERMAQCSTRQFHGQSTRGEPRVKCPKKKKDEWRWELSKAFEDNRMNIFAND